VLHGIRDEETCMDLPPTGERTRLRSGTPGYRRASGVLFVAGFMGFSMLYVAQGILPDLSRDFSVSPAAASLTLSLTTLPLAVAVLVAASWSEGQGRRLLLVGAVLSAAALTLAASAAPSFGVLLVLRVLTGLVLAGLPAVAMAYVAEEFHPSGLGTAMGLYISGTGLGGMTGRLAGGLLASTWSWRVAMAAVGGVCLIGGLWVALRLPSSRNFVATPGSMRERMARLRGPLRDPVIIRFALCGFVLMGSLVSFFNYLQYRLVGAPFNLSATLVALVFLLYLFGTVSANWMGRLADRRSRRGVLLLAMAIMAAGGLLTLSDLLPQVLAGAAAMVFGFFGAHSVTSGWVGFWATQQRAQSSALYLFGYHIGSSVAGFVGGLFFAAFGWPGEVGTVLVLLAVGLLVALSLPAARDHAPFAEPT
jgi:MFS transporter, YNFM family, putative membrane transport protein